MWIQILPIGILLGVGLAVLTIGLLRAFGVRFKWWRFACTLVVAVAISVGYFHHLKDATPQKLQEQNQIALAEWQAQQCVAPEEVVPYVFWSSSTEKRGRSTAFLLSTGIVVTNRHAARDNPELLLRTHEGAEYTVSGRYMADAQTGPDIAFYNGQEVSDQGLPIATAAPQPGEQLLIVGQPSGRERFYASVVTVYDVGPAGSVQTPERTWLTQFTDAIDREVRRRKGKLRTPDRGANQADKIIYQGDTGPGNSGSPILNCQGEVVGVHYAGRRFYWFASEQTGYGLTYEALVEEILRYHDEGRDLDAT